MTHSFFNSFSQPTAMANIAAKTSAYDLQVKATSIAAGLAAEMRDDGTIVAVKYPTGVSVRRNSDFVVVQTLSAVWFTDRWGGVHPFD